jgi:recombination protein RecA
MYHKKGLPPNNYKLTKEQREVVIASAYGDGSLRKGHQKSKSARLRWNMGDTEHAIFKKNYFDFLGSDLKKNKNGGFGEYVYSVQTKSHNCLNEIYEKIFKEGKKTLSEDLFSELGDIGYAWLYGDDGHLNKKCGYCYIHTESFNKEENVKIIKIINNYLGGDYAKLNRYIGGTKKRELFCIRFTKQGTEELHKRIAKHMAPSMEYKLLPSYRGKKDK